MSQYGRCHTLVRCSGQLLASKIHSNFNQRNKTNENFVVLLINIFLHGKIWTTLQFSILGTISLKSSVTGASTLGALSGLWSRVDVKTHPIKQRSN